MADINLITSTIPPKVNELNTVCVHLALMGSEKLRLSMKLDPQIMVIFISASKILFFTSTGVIMKGP